MTRHTHALASRRVFLQNIALASAAAATSQFGWPVPTRAEEDLLGEDEHAVPLQWDSLPNAAAAGAVILETDWGDFAIFPAVQSAEIGESAPAGTAVVELQGCTARTFAYSTDDDQSERPRFYCELKAGAVYQVENSLWLQRITDEELERIDAEPSSKSLHHFCFTFNATTFHCIAEKLTMQVRSESFATIAADLAARGAGD